MKKIFNYKYEVRLAIISLVLICICFCFGFKYYSIFFISKNNKKLNLQAEINYNNIYENQTNKYNKLNGMVLQNKEGVYFIHENRLMFMDKKGNSVKEVLDMENEIFELSLVKGIEEDNIIFADEKHVYLYENGNAKKIIDTTESVKKSL